MFTQLITPIFEYIPHETRNSLKEWHSSFSRKLYVIESHAKLGAVSGGMLGFASSFIINQLNPSHAGALPIITTIAGTILGTIAGTVQGTRTAVGNEHYPYYFDIIAASGAGYCIGVYITGKPDASLGFAALGGTVGISFATLHITVDFVKRHIFAQPTHA